MGPWWGRLPADLDHLAGRWDLTLGEPVGRGHTSLVLRCRLGDGRGAVLKLCPDPEVGRAEARALDGWAPSGRVPLVWGHDAAAGALLLEAIPGETPLAEAGTEVGMDDVAGLIGALHRVGAPNLGGGVVALAERVELVFGLWVERLGRSPDAARAVSVERLEHGRVLARRLAGRPARPVLLHGDLHPGNVLDGGAARGLVAVDPRPCVGDAAVDAVDWVFWAAEDPASWRPRCRELAAALGVDDERLWAWCRAFAAMLAAGTAARGGPSDRVAALLALGP